LPTAQLALPRPRTTPSAHGSRPHRTDVTVRAASPPVPHVPEAEGRQCFLVGLIEGTTVLGAGHGFTRFVDVVGKLSFLVFLRLAGSVYVDMSEVGAGRGGIGTA